MERLPPERSSRLRLYGCTCNCLPFLLGMVGVGLWLGYQLGLWLAQGGAADWGPVLVAGGLIVIGLAGLARQLSRLRWRR